MTHNLRTMKQPAQAQVTAPIDPPFIRDQVREHAQRAGLTGERLDDLVLAVNEAVTNVLDPAAALARSSPAPNPTGSPCRSSMSPTHSPTSTWPPPTSIRPASADLASGSSSTCATRSTWTACTAAEHGLEVLTQ